LFSPPSLLLGLDSFNAALLVDCLRDLASKNATNVVMTIHQPRSNVFTGFDRNLVLNQGEVTWFGKTKEVGKYFEGIGHPIPSDYNAADFLIDVLFLTCLAKGGGEEWREGGVVVQEKEKVGGLKSWLPKQLLGRGGGGGGKGGAGGAVVAGGASSSSSISGGNNVTEVELVEGWGEGGRPRFKPQGSRATFRQRLGSPGEGVREGGVVGFPAVASPPRVVRVDMGEGGREGGLEDSEFKHGTLEEEKEARFDGASPPTLASGPIMRHHTNSSLRSSSSSSSTAGTTAAAAAAGGGGGQKLEHLLPTGEVSNPFASAFRRSDAYRNVLAEMDGLLREGEGEGGREGGKEEEEGEGDGGSNTTGSDGEEGTFVNTSPAGEGGKVGSASSSASTVMGQGHQQLQQEQHQQEEPVKWKTRAWTGTRRWCWEVGVLSRRSLLDLTRNPVLFLSHVGATTYFAIVLGTVYYSLSMSSLQAIQNRLGAFLLACVFLCFTSVSALPLFWLEKNLYLHEQSNRFYSASAYFVCKVFFDLIPLRVVPTLIFGAVTYGMIGLRPGFQHFVIYEAFLVLLVCTSALINLIIGMLTRHIMSGILIATIVMIHFLMLTNLFINFDTMSVVWLRFLRRVSFFNYAYEGKNGGKEGGREGWGFLWYL